MKSILSLVALAGAAAIASASVPTITVANYVINGDFVAAGGSSRTSAGVPDAFDIAMPAISGTAVRSFLVWNHLTDNPGSAGESRIYLNTVEVNAAGVNAATPDLCWGLTYTATYIADVTGLVIHGGANSIRGAGDGVSPNSLGEGVSLLTVYEDANLPLQNIDIFWNGNPGDIANNLIDGINNWKFSNAYLGGPAHTFTNALDGQGAGSDFLINGSSAIGALGTGAFDPWIGNAGPYYDHADGDASAYMTVGDTSMEIGTFLFNDCVGHTFGAIAFSAIPSPGSLAVVGLGLLASSRRRR